MSGSTGHAGDKGAGNPLQTLIEVRRHELGLSYGRIAARAGLPRSTVYYLATTSELQRSPAAHTVERLAEALELPPQTVRSAVAHALGLHVYVEGEPAQPDLAVLMASVEQLAPEDREHVAALVRSLLLRRRQDGQGEPDAAPPASR